MTFDDWDHKLPNGFHDAEISDIKIDYVQGTLTMNMNLLIDAGSGRPNAYGAALVEVFGLQFCSIGPPSANYPYQRRNAVTVSGDPAKSYRLPELEALRPNFPPNTECYRFFVDDWNNFIYIAAANVEVTWKTGASTLPE